MNKIKKIILHIFSITNLVCFFGYTQTTAMKENLENNKIIEEISLNSENVKNSIEILFEKNINSLLENNICTINILKNISEMFSHDFYKTLDLHPIFENDLYSFYSKILELIFSTDKNIYNLENFESILNTRINSLLNKMNSNTTYLQAPSDENKNNLNYSKHMLLAKYLRKNFNDKTFEKHMFKYIFMFIKNKIHEKYINNNEYIKIITKLEKILDIIFDLNNKIIYFDENKNNFVKIYFYNEELKNFIVKLQKEANLNKTENNNINTKTKLLENKIEKIKILNEIINNILNFLNSFISNKMETNSRMLKCLFGDNICNFYSNIENFHIDKIPPKKEITKIKTTTDDSFNENFFIENTNKLINDLINLKSISPELLKNVKLEIDSDSFKKRLFFMCKIIVEHLFNLPYRHNYTDIYDKNKDTIKLPKAEYNHKNCVKYLKTVKEIKKKIIQKRLVYLYLTEFTIKNISNILNDKKRKYISYLDCANNLKKSNNKHKKYLENYIKSISSEKQKYEECDKELDIILGRYFKLQHIIFLSDMLADDRVLLTHDNNIQLLNSIESNDIKTFLNILNTPVNLQNLKNAKNHRDTVFGFKWPINFIEWDSSADKYILKKEAKAEIENSENFLKEKIKAIKNIKQNFNWPDSLKQKREETENDLKEKLEKIKIFKEILNKSINYIYEINLLLNPDFIYYLFGMKI